MTQTPEQVYNKGVKTLQAIQKKLPDNVADYAYAFGQAIGYMRESAKMYEAAELSELAKATYEVLAQTLETEVADTLFDIGQTKAAAHDVRAAIFSFDLARKYYVEALSLNQYSQTPELTLHFSILNVLDELIKVNPAKKSTYANEIVLHIVGHRLEAAVHESEEQAQEYRTLLSSYYKLLELNPPVMSPVYTQAQSNTLFKPAQSIPAAVVISSARELESIQILEQIALAHSHNRYPGAN